jgi:PPK2 family polyphosphate:nucleotide phosphotransferase
VKLQTYRARTDGRFRLKDHDPQYTDGIHTKDEAERKLLESIGRLRVLQSKLYAQDRWALLLILQAMDAAGKDSTIEHVMSGVNPQGCEVHSFKAPSDEELDHDFLWRTSRQVPRRGHIGIFNRSYYEEVLVVRVHPELLEREKLPRVPSGRRLWEERYQDICNHERYLTRNGVAIRKVFLHVSKAEQRRRFLARLDEPNKQWKFSMHDVEERGRWRDYMRAYEEMIAATSTEYAPWYVVPADHKWFTRLIVSHIIIEALEEMDLRYPSVESGNQRELARIRRALFAE